MARRASEPWPPINARGDPHGACQRPKTVAAFACHARCVCVFSTRLGRSTARITSVRCRLRRALHPSRATCRRAVQFLHASARENLCVAAAASVQASDQGAVRRRVQLDLPRLDELHHRQRGEGFGCGAEHEGRLRSGRLAAGARGRRRADARFCGPRRWRAQRQESAGGASAPRCKRQ